MPHPPHREEEPARGERVQREAGEQGHLRAPGQGRPRRLVHSAPGPRLRRGGEEAQERRGVDADVRQGPLRVRVQLRDLEVGDRQQPAHPGEQHRADRVRDEQPRPERAARRPAPDEPGDGGDQRRPRQHVRERQPDAEAQAELPGGHRPARIHPPDAPPLGAVAVAQRPAVPPGQHGQRERDAAVGDDVQVPRLGEQPRRVRVARPGHRRARAPRAELPGQHVRPERGQRMGQHEHDVVAQQGGLGAGADHAGRCVPEQRVGEGEAPRLGEERVGVPQLRRFGQQDVP